MELLDALLLLKEKAVTRSIVDTRFGICSNLSRLTSSDFLSYRFVRNNCEDWEHFSGDVNYPIEGCGVEGLWEGKQLDLRLSLLDHLITKAKELGV